jgi:hypothetical protein
VELGDGFGPARENIAHWVRLDRDIGRRSGNGAPRPIDFRAEELRGKAIFRAGIKGTT